MNIEIVLQRLYSKYVIVQYCNDCDCEWNTVLLCTGCTECPCAKMLKLDSHKLKQQCQQGNINYVVLPVLTAGFLYIDPPGYLFFNTSFS